MQEAVRERNRYSDGFEIPIECHDRRVGKSRSDIPRSPHYHDHIEFLFATEKCDINVWIAGENVPFRTGDMIIINADVAHTFVNRIDGNAYICIKALPEMLYSSESTFFDLKYVTPFFHNNLVNYRKYCADEMGDNTPRTAFVSSLEEWKKKNYGYEIALKSLLLEILLWTVRYDSAKGNLYHGDDDFSETVRLIRRSVEYINENYADVTEVLAAASVNMSYSHYSRQFKRVMGKSFCEYLTATRVNAAERLLLSTELSVTEVSETCGFSTSSHFIDKFKRCKGVTPARYRQIWWKNQNDDLHNLP